MRCECESLEPDITCSPIVPFLLKLIRSLFKVRFELLNETEKGLGAWFDLDLSVGGGDGVALTAKVFHNELFAYITKSPVADAEGGCCAGTLRVYDRESGNVTE